MRVLAIAVLLAGCATIDQKVAGLTTSEVCFIQTQTGLETERQAARRELARRNAPCTDQMALQGAELWTQRKARQAQESAAWAATGAALIAGSQPGYQSPTPTVQTYFIGGRYVTCSTLGAITSCR